MGELVVGTTTAGDVRDEGRGRVEGVEWDAMPSMSFNSRGVSLRGVRRMFAVISMEEEHEGEIDMATRLLSLDL